MEKRKYRILTKKSGEHDLYATRFTVTAEYYLLYDDSGQERLVAAFSREETFAVVDVSAESQGGQR